MHLNQATAVLVGLSLAVPLASPAGAQTGNPLSSLPGLIGAQTGASTAPEAPDAAGTPTKSSSPLSSIFNCAATGKKQVGGAALGGVVGGVVGNRVAKGDRTLGTALGAALGAAAGSYIGCRMQRGDQRKAEAAAKAALERNGSSSWRNPETGASGEVRVVADAQRKPVSLSGVRFAKGVELAAGYEGAAGRYQARNGANLRGSPSTSGQVVGKLAAGEGFDALARAQGTNWLLAGREGAAVGYVSETVVRPTDAVASASNCRTFDQTIKTSDAAADKQRYTACRNPAGEWVVQS